ncbi:MAG: HGGxSTG domain-containing protein [Dongiaceae bacterium]
MTRTSAPCRNPAMPNGRCRMHGGKSTGPRTEEGRSALRWPVGSTAAGPGSISRTCRGYVL